MKHEGGGYHVPGLHTVTVTSLQDVNQVCQSAIFVNFFKPHCMIIGIYSYLLLISLADINHVHLSLTSLRDINHRHLFITYLRALNS